MAEKLYIEYRIHLDPSASDDTVSEVAERFKDYIYDSFDPKGVDPPPFDIKMQDVTYDIIRFPVFESNKETDDEVQ